MIQRYMLVVCISSFAVCAGVAQMALSAEPGRENQAEAGRLRYIPDPKPVRTPILIGAHHCPLWEADKPQMWANVLKHPERTPALGFYSQENPEVADWETKWAVEHGIALGQDRHGRTRQQVDRQSHLRRRYGDRLSPGLAGRQTLVSRCR